MILLRQLARGPKTLSAAPRYATATTTTEPRERPFYYPTFWQEHEPLAACGTSHHLQAPSARGLGGDPLVKAMIMILAIRP